MKQNALPEIPETALRDYGKGRHIDRGWKRLEQELGPALVLRRSPLWWAPALAVVTFGAGLFVGARFLRHEAQAPVAAEPRTVPQPEHRPAAGALAAPQPGATANRTPRSRQPQVAPEVPLPEPPEPLSVMEPPPPEYTPVAPLAGPPDWERYAELGDFSGAKSALNAAGGFDAVFRSATPGQLMTLGDIARASGNRDQALRALGRLIDAFPGAAEAPEAAWTLGNMLHQAGDKAGAGEAYALYRRLSPTGDFAEDAAAREVDIALSQGNVERAAALVEEYARSFPKSRRLARFRADLKKLTDPATAADPNEKPVPETDDEAEELDEAPPPAPLP